ncbi:MAG: ATP-dependent sacrificial sulfur transferase LarE [Candidatus Jordarchaeum sp.]|uniref:ATP-dependent sacrificial sulfur transferase LarE n=1 Tax=Candidatus Jordarchaeum sp. TaxID=2823881 RepID=UPI00404B8AC3
MGSQKIQSKIDQIRNTLKDKTVMVAFSGGVDSSLMVSLAKDVSKKVLAITINSQIIPPEDVERAKQVARELGVNHTVIWVDRLSNSLFVANPPNRCYYCKKELSRTLKKIANEKGYELIVEGTNTSDIVGHRPGALALQEEGILSPFLTADVTKEEIRLIARERGLSVSDQPSMACLASRISYGEAITDEKLHRIAEAERYIKQISSVTIVRVRTHRNLARIELGKDEREKLFSIEILDKIAEKMKGLGFKYCTLDVEGYRTGAMDEVLKEKITLQPPKASKKLNS